MADKDLSIMKSRKCSLKRYRVNYLSFCVLFCTIVASITFYYLFTLKQFAMQNTENKVGKDIGKYEMYSNGDTKLKYNGDIGNIEKEYYKVIHGGERKSNARIFGDKSNDDHEDVSTGILPIEIPPLKGIKTMDFIQRRDTHPTTHSHGRKSMAGAYIVNLNYSAPGNMYYVTGLGNNENTDYTKSHTETLVSHKNGEMANERHEEIKLFSTTSVHSQSHTTETSNFHFVPNSYAELPHDAKKVKENMPGLKFGMPRKAKTHKIYWQVLEDSKEVYLLSSYYDDRPGLEMPMIRVIGIVEANTTGLHCLHWYDKQSYPDVVMADLVQIGPFINPVNTKKYGQYLLSCRLAPDKHPPIFVSIVTPSSIRTSTLLVVQWPVKTQNPHDFGLCTSVLYWQHNPYRLVEWLEALKMWGVGEITAYNNSMDPISSMIFSHYSDIGFVDLRQITNVLDDDGELTILMNMSPVINDCMYRNLYRYKHVLSLDLDELIVPRRHNNYTAMLKAIKNKQSPKQQVMSYMFRNLYFFDDLGPAKSQPWYLWTMRYLKHIRPSTRGYSVKSFTDPQVCIGLQNHLCWRKMPKYENVTTWNIDVDMGLGMNHHYKKCHFDNFLEKNGVCHKMMKDYREDPSMLRFEDLLGDVVVRKLLELDMIEKI